MENCMPTCNKCGYTTDVDFAHVCAVPGDPTADEMLDWLSDMDNAADIGVYGIDDSGDLRQRIVRAMKANTGLSGR
jgi:hypothetical protein